MNGDLDQALFDLMQTRTPEACMDLALREAERARESDEVPVGAVVIDVPTGRLVAKAYNQRELLQDSTAHAEMLAITQAAAHYESWRLTQAALFVTLEQCVMCAGAIVLARIPYVFYGTTDPKAGAHCSLYEVLENDANNHVPKVTGGVRQEESSRILTDFFRAKRRTSSAPINGSSNGNGNGAHGESS